MKSKAILAAAVLLQASFSFAETVKLRSGEELQDGVASVDAGSVTLDSGRTLPRAAVSEIQFTAARAAKKQETPAASPEEAKAAREAFVRAAAAARAHPGVNGIILLDSGEYRLNPDGTTVYRNRQVRQILKDSLKTAWGQAGGCGEEGRERVKITRASVYLPDGRIFTLDPAGIKTSRPQSEGGDFFVSGSVCTLYAMPNVQVGAIVDYETVTETYNPFRKDFFFPEWGFQESQGPILLSEITIAVPEKETLAYSVRNFSAFGSSEPVISTGAGFKEYHWKLENVPPMTGEPAMSAFQDVTPNLRGAVFSDWGRIFDWMGAMHEERSRPSAELEKFTRELVKDAAGEEEKAAKIYHYVQKEIRYIAVKVGVASGWGGYDADLTWKRRYGCCIDKAILLTAMFRAAGLKSSTVILNTNNSHETDFSVPQIGFNHAITVAGIGGRQVFLDSTGYDYRYPQIAGFDYGVDVLNIFEKKIVPVPVPAPAENGSFYDCSVKFSSAGAAEVTTTVRYSGSLEGATRSYYRSIKKEEQKQGFQSAAKTVAPSARLLSYEVSNAENIEKPFSMTYSFSVPDYPQRAGNILIVKIPDFEISTYRTSEVSLDKRRYPIEYEGSMGRYQRYEISLPENLEVVSLPEKLSLSNKYASFSADCTQPSKGAIVCSTSWERPQRLVSPGDYADYKAFIEKAANHTKNQIFLRDLAAKEN